MMQHLVHNGAFVPESLVWSHACFHLTDGGLDAAPLGAGCSGGGDENHPGKKVSKV